MNARVLLVLWIAMVFLGACHPFEDTDNYGLPDLEMCENGESQCDGLCVDTLSNAAYCGGCSISCSSGEKCEDGLCVASCLEGEADCGYGCQDILNDSANCGFCGLLCPEGQDCVAGICLDSCFPPAEWCGGECVDTQTDPENCGSCEALCEGLCVSGECMITCPSGETSCNGICTDLDWDQENCGACDMACSENEYCSSGVCLPCACPAGQGCVGGNCYKSCEDDGACPCDSTMSECPLCIGGYCGFDCSGDGAIDSNLPCEPSCEECLGALCSEGGCLLDCDDDGSPDFPQPCGGCGNAACTGGEECVNGICQCPEGWTNKAGECVPFVPDSCEGCGQCCWGECLPNGEERPEDCSLCPEICGNEGSCISGECVRHTQAIEDFDVDGRICLIVSDSVEGLLVDHWLCWLPEWGEFARIELEDGADVLGVAAAPARSCVLTKDVIYCTEWLEEVDAFEVEHETANPFDIELSESWLALASTRSLRMWDLWDELFLTLPDAFKLALLGYDFVDLSCNSETCCALKSREAEAALVCYINEHPSPAAFSDAEEIELSESQICIRHDAGLDCTGFAGDPSISVEPIAEGWYRYSQASLEAGDYLALGEGYTCVLGDLNTQSALVCWGEVPGVAATLVGEPLLVFEDSAKIRAIKGGDESICFLWSGADPGLYCFGHNEFNQIDNSPETSIHPARAHRIWPPTANSAINTWTDLP